MGTCECGNEPSGSIKCGEFLDTEGTLLHAVKHRVIESTFSTAQQPRSQLLSNKELERICNQDGFL